jgi:hypothetical protein
MQVKLLGDLGRRFSKLPDSLKKIVLQDMETAATNRISVMERIKD